MRKASFVGRVTASFILLVNILGEKRAKFLGAQFLIRCGKETSNPKLNARKTFNQIRMLTSPPERKVQAGTSEQKVYVSKVIGKVH